MTTISASNNPHRAVRWWLISVAALIALMVLVGGATRLTNRSLDRRVEAGHGQRSSALGGAVGRSVRSLQEDPAISRAQRGYEPAEFKQIFWWEWSHRLIGRFIGVAYLLPFLFFLWRGGLSGDLKRRLWLLFALGGLQGAVGWWMVASGLTERVEVSQYRLATHLLLALLIFAGIVWTVRRLKERPQIAAPARLRFTSACCSS